MRLSPPSQHEEQLRRSQAEIHGSLVSVRFRPGSREKRERWNLNPQMQSTVEGLLASGKGILAADDSFPTIEKRFKALGIVSTEEARRAYREMLFTTPWMKPRISIGSTAPP